MNNFILKVGYTDDRPEVSKLVEETIHLLISNHTPCWNKKFMDQKRFKIPCGTECLDVSCQDLINCNLMTYNFSHYSEEIPQNLINLHAILTMFEPVVGVTLSKENDHEGKIWWSRFDEDGDIEEYQGVLN